MKHEAVAKRDLEGPHPLRKSRTTASQAAEVFCGDEFFHFFEYFVSRINMFVCQLVVFLEEKPTFRVMRFGCLCLFQGFLKALSSSVMCLYEGS